MNKLLTFILTALLAFGVGWAETVADVITAANLAATTTTYTDFNDVSITSNAVYAGNSAKGTNSVIQMRSKNSSGIVSTASGGTLLSVKISVYNGTNTIDVYGSNTAYTSAADLYSSSTQGTKLGSVSSTSTITVTGNYAYVGIRSNSGAVYISKIEITWKTGGSTPTPTQVATIAAAEGLAANTAFEFTGNAVVTYQNGDNLWIRDTSGSGLIYGSGVGTFANGDVLTSGWTATNSTSTQGVPQFVSPAGVASSTNSGAEVPEALTTLSTADVNKYASISNITITRNNSNNYYFEVNGNEYCVRNHFGTVTLTVGKTYNVVGVVSIYNDAPQLYLISAEEVHNPVIIVNPSTLTIDDSGSDNTFTVEGSYLGGDNVGLTHTNNNFTPSLSATTGSTYDGGSYRGFTPANGSLIGTVAMSYTGRELRASTTVTLANNLTSAVVTVNYVPDLYIVTDNGVTDDWHFDGTHGVHMTNNNGVYTAAFTANNPNTFILFARKLGDGVTWNTRYVFGPSSGGDWCLPASGNGNGTIDLNTSHPIKIQDAGTYIVTINANDNTFTITKETVIEGDFTLVTAVNQLNAGDEIIFVSSNTAGDDDAKAMSTTQNQNNRGVTTVAVSTTQKVTATDETQIFTLEGDASNGWYFKTVNGETQGYIYAASSSNNHLKTKADADDNAKASISVASDGVTTIVFQGNYTRNDLRYNSSSNLYSCYASTSTQAKPYIYRRGASIISEPSITVTPSDALDLGTIAAGGTQTSATFTVQGFNLNANDVVTLSVDAPYFSVSPTTISAADAMAGAVTVTVTYAGPDYAANATVTIGSQNGDFEDVTLPVTAHREAIAVTITPADGSTFMGNTVNGIIEANVAGATIEYSFDGNTWMIYDPDEGFSATVDYVGGEVTVYARARYNGETSAVAQATYTRVGKAATCTADIVFAPTTSNGSFYSWEELRPHVAEDSRDYITSADVASLIPSQTYSAMRFGSSSVLGNLSLTLNLSNFEGGKCKLTKVTINAARFSNDGEESALKVSTDVATDGVTKSITTGQNNFADYVFNFDGREITTLTIGNISTSGRVYVHSISLEYNCGSAVETPEITPASGTYYEDQTVTITGDGNSTIYYTTDGSSPLTSPTRQEYNGSFNAEYVPGGTTIIKAVAVDDEDNVSEMTTVTYAWGVPSVNIVPGSTNVTEPTTIAVTITDKGADDAVIYYTTDGTTPNENSQVYDGSFDVTLSNVGDEVTVKAIVVSDGYTSSVATATYKYVENTVEMIDPYFSPISNHTYYGDQTVEILCPIPGAIMYYEMAQASGTEAPAATAVTQPSRSSSQYGTPITLTEGNSYYIKAVAYVGNSVSHIVEGWYTILPTSEWTGPNARVLESVSELQNVSSSTAVTFRNPVQVVYMSLFTNDSTPTGYGNPIPEFCYVHDNTGYGLIYFGKGATEWAEYTSGRTNSPATFYKMGDWIDGSQIVGTTGTWTNGLIPQLGTNSHVITSWPASAIGHTRIMAQETTCRDINAANTVQNNMCGHYVHLRNTTVNWSQDNNPTASDPDYRNFGRYTDGTATASMYDRFWLFSGYGQTYTYHNDDYTLKGVGDYNTDFFNYYQSRGATFDIFAIGAYYNDNYEHDGETGFIGSEILPIDYLWIYPPTIVTPNDTPYEGEATIVIEGDTVSWSDNTPTIYYRTDDMEDWAVYDAQNPPVITSSTTVYTYTELPAVKNDGTDYSDFIHSPVVQRSYVIEGIDDPVISPASRLVDISDGPQTLRVTVTTGEGCTSTEGTYYTVYTTDGTEPYWHSADDYNGTIIEGVAGTFNSFNIDTTTTVTAVTYYVLDGVVELQSNVKSETYTFVKKNGVTYNILTDAPQVGTIVVVVNKAHNVAMSTRQNTTNRGSVGVIFTDESKDVVYGNDEIAQFVVESAGANRYYLRNVNGDSPGYLYVNSSSANLLTESALDSEGKAASSINIGAASDNVDERYVATVTYAYEGVPRYLRYYDNGHAFSTYAHAGLHEDIFLYGIEATPLSFIEENKRKGDHVVVSDQLVGTWAVVDGDTKLLWVKDMGNRSIIPTYNNKQAVDYMMEYCGSNPQRYEWDQSNWAIIDFSKQSADPTTYVNKVIQGSTIVGTYSDELNYTITLDATSEGGVEPVAMADALGYHGYVSDAHGDPLEIQYSDYHYNQYTPVNFLEKNLNEPWGPGAKAGDNARAIAPGTPMFFMNPKIMEVAHVWAVYDGMHDGYHRFDVYENSGSYNGFDMEGSFDVLDWSYNRKDDNSYGMPGDLAEGKAYMFHVVVARQNFQYGHRNVAPMRGVGAMGSAASSSMGVYPLDLPSGNGGLTAVTEVQATKEVESVRFYNLMGVESAAPFDGINIVVTRYTDGSISSCKIMR